MSFMFTKENLAEISLVLGVEPKILGNNIRFEVNHHDSSRKLTLEIYSEIPIGSKSGTLVTVYTANSHLQLHFVTGFVVSEMCEEVTFVAESNRKVSGLIIEKLGGCSLFCNVDREVLSGDFSQMAPEVMLSSIALSLTEHILQSPSDQKEE
ncbi:MAG: hypothetical protein LCH54_08160 [Bacteroidetes bacterium]|nr:hypothetical protein [Bacteroidota bacterium]